MSVNACARIVKEGDPDRFLAAMAAPVDARRVLFPLYALNIEVSRAPWLTQESMIAEMRLQWWRDVLTEIREGGVVRRHEVVDAVAEVLDADGATALDGLVELRRWDIYKEPFEDDAHFWSYLDETAGNLMWISARALGAKDEAAIRAYARMHGLANWFLAVPELEARGRMPLPDGRPEAVAALARTALEGVRGLRFEKAAQPALLAGWQARSLLMQVVDHPARVAAGALGLSPIGKRLRLIKQSVFGE